MGLQRKQDTIVVKFDYLTLQSPDPQAFARWLIRKMGAIELSTSNDQVLVKIPNVGPCKIVQSGNILPKKHHLAVVVPNIQEFAETMSSAGCPDVFGKDHWRIFAIAVSSRTVGYIHAAVREKPLGT